MANLAIVLVATFVFTAQCAVFRNEESLKRIARSPCDTCDHHGPPGFPPPPFPHPPRFHTHNWSGYARNADGSQQGVFSGAAAQASDGTQSGGEAYSLAAAEANAQGNTGNKNSYGAQHKEANDAHQFQSNVYGSSSHSQGAYGSSSHGSGIGRGDLGNEQQIQSGGFGSASQSQAKSSYGTSGNLPRESGYGRGYSGNQQQGGIGSEVNSQAQSSSGSSNGGYHHQGGSSGGHASESSSGRGDLGNLQQMQSGFGSASNSQAQSSLGSTSGGYGSHRGYQNNHQQAQTGAQSAAQSQALSSSGSSGSGYGGHLNNHEAENLQQVQQHGSQGLSAGQGGYGGQNQRDLSQQQQGSYGYGSGSGSSQYDAHQSSHEALKGALDLAHQGLQSSSQDGCSTCGKSSYALSNAKSHSGNAVALSIGG